MNKYYAALIQKEFPFVWTINPFSTLCKPEDVNKFKVARADARLMRSKPVEYVDYTSNDFTQIFAVWVEGGDWRVERLRGSGYHQIPQKLEWDCSTVGEQLFEGKINPEFIVVATQACDGRADYWEIIVYKMGRFDLMAYHEDQIDKAVDELKRQLRAIAD